MSRAVFVRRTGGPEVLRVEDHDPGAPGPGQLRVRNRAIGLNFVDTYQRSGAYPLPLPFIAGNEGAGVVVAVGEGTGGFKAGDRVAYMGPVGAYADERLLPADSAVHIPADVSDEAAAALMMKGGTAYYLLHMTWPLQAGETALVHAAAGGVGSLLAQWGSAMGARIIGTAGSAEKVERARANGCEAAIDYRQEDWPAKVRAATGGRGVDVIYDGVGRAVFEGNVDCLRPRGLLASYGSASGAVSIPSLAVLANKGSLYVTRPTSRHYIGTPETLREAMAAVFAALAAGKIRVAIDQRFPLAEAAEAHRALEARETTGMTLLIP
ncbi:MAG: quinone oxidoreductase [Devosia sp.]